MNTTATLVYVNEDGEEIRMTRDLSPEALAAVIMAMDEGE